MNLSLSRNQIFFLYDLLEDYEKKCSLKLKHNKPCCDCIFFGSCDAMRIEAKMYKSLNKDNLRRIAKNETEDLFY